MATMTGTALANEETTIRAVLENYWKAADNRDISMLDQVFHEDYQVIALTADGRRIINKEDYLGLIKAGKIGGTKRDFELTNLSVEGVVAQGRLLLKGPAVTFQDHITLTREDGTWRLVSNVTEVVPN